MQLQHAILRPFHPAGGTHGGPVGFDARPGADGRLALNIRAHCANEAGDILFAPPYSTAVDDRPVISVFEQIDDRTGTIRTMGYLVIAGMRQRLYQGRGVEDVAGQKDFHAATLSSMEDMQFL
jgi:hypothetical protein